MFSELSTSLQALLSMKTIVIELAKKSGFKVVLFPALLVMLNVLICVMSGLELFERYIFVSGLLF